jgi:hypothetical protein
MPVSSRPASVAFNETGSDCIRACMVKVLSERLIGRRSH